MYKVIGEAMKPGYLGINWKPDDEHTRLAEPFKPITREEFDGTLHCNHFGLNSINYDSVYFPGSERRGFRQFSVHYYLFHNECVAVLNAVVHKPTDRPIPQPSNAAYAEYNGYMHNHVLLPHWLSASESTTHYSGDV
jgi:hypothetical protein